MWGLTHASCADVRAADGAERPSQRAAAVAGWILVLADQRFGIDDGDALEIRKIDALVFCHQRFKEYTQQTAQHVLHRTGLFILLVWMSLKGGGKLTSLAQHILDMKTTPQAFWQDKQ